MNSRNQVDALGGVLLSIIGFVYFLDAIGNYSLGTLRSLGAGMFPAGLGVILTLLGAAIAFKALREPARSVRLKPRAVFMVLASICLFALLIETCGLAPATIAAVVLSFFAERSVDIKGLAILSIVIALLGVLIFKVGLGMPISIVRWPL